MFSMATTTEIKVWDGGGWGAVTEEGVGATPDDDDDDGNKGARALDIQGCMKIINTSYASTRADRNARSD